MARIRTVKPEFFHSKDIAKVSHSARLLAIALLQMADCQGRMNYIPMQIHAHAFPWEAEVNTQMLLGELKESGFVIHYEFEGREYLSIPNFLKHQRLQGKEAQMDSKIPPFSLETCINKGGNTQMIPGELGLDSLGMTGTGEQGNRGSRNRGTGEQGVAGKPSALPAAAKDDEPSCSSRVWDAYKTAYQERYGSEPVRNAKINGQIAQFVSRVPKDAAPSIAAFFVRHNANFYVTKMHPIGLLLSDAEKLHTEWVTKKQMTGTRARQIDESQTSVNVADEAREIYLRMQDSKAAGAH